MFYSLSLVSNLFDGNGDIIISYEDIIFNINLLNNLLSSKEEFTIIEDKNQEEYRKLRMVNYQDDVENFHLNLNRNNNSIEKKWKNKEEIFGLYVGLFKIKKKIQHIFKNKPEEIYENKNLHNIYMTDFIQSIIGKSIKLSPLFIDNGYLEFDNPEDLNKKFIKFLRGINFFLTIYKEYKDSKVYIRLQIYYFFLKMNIKIQYF